MKADMRTLEHVTVLALSFLTGISLAPTAPAAEPQKVEGVFKKPVTLRSGDYQITGLVSCEGGLTFMPGVRITFAPGKSLLSIRKQFVARGNAQAPTVIVGGEHAGIEVIEAPSLVKLDTVQLKDLSIAIDNADKLDMSNTRMTTCRFKLKNFAHPSALKFATCSFESMTGFEISRSGNFLSMTLEMDGCRIDAEGNISITAGGKMLIQRSRFSCHQLDLRLEAAGRLEGSSIINRGLTTQFSFTDSEVKAKVVSLDFNRAWLHELSFRCVGNNFLDLDTFKLGWDDILKAPNNYWGTDSEDEIKKRMNSLKLFFKPFAPQPLQLKTTKVQKGSR